MFFRKSTIRYGIVNNYIAGKLVLNKPKFGGKLAPTDLFG